MSKEHYYNVSIEWTGNCGSGTSAYNAYKRDHSISSSGKTIIEASADPAFRGDASKYNPEEFLVASLATCHMLWFLHLCADAGVVVTQYHDNPNGTLLEDAQGSGTFKEVVLHPTVVVKQKEMLDKVEELHKQAHKKCFIAKSVNFDVKHISSVSVEQIKKSE
jgi:organic hydroperoxide reductase OsmC/OhrA